MLGEGICARVHRILALTSQLYPLLFLLLRRRRQIEPALRLRQRPSVSGVPRSTMSHFKSGSRVKCTTLAVLCGKVGKQRTPPGPVPESQRPRPSFPFPELISSGRLDVHTLINPTVDQFLEAQRALQPRFIYLQGQLLDNEEEIGTLVWGDADVSDPQTFSSLICSPFPTIVYLEVPSGEKIARSLQSKGILYIMYWRYSLSSYAASHFRHSLLSVVQSSCSHAWDAFQLAYASFEQYCLRNNEVQCLMLGPHLLGDAPRIYITPPGSKRAEEEDTSEYFPDIKIYDEDVHLKLLICGAHCTPDSSILNSLEDGLNALLNIEFRWCKLQDRVSAAPPLHVDSALLDGVVTICCDITTSSSSHVSLLLSGSPQTCFDDELSEKHIKKELIESRRLVHVVSVSEDDGPSSAEPFTSMSVASGASTFEVLMTLPKWASQVLKYLAQETSYKSLVPLGIASVNGTPVSSFDKEDVDRLLFFCTNQDEDEAIGNGLYHHPPRWSASLAKDRVKGNMVSKPEQVVQPNLMYLQGQQLENEEEIGTLVWGEADVSDLLIFSSLTSPPFPTIAFAGFNGCGSVVFFLFNHTSFPEQLNGEVHDACSAVRQAADATWSNARVPAAAAIIPIPGVDLVWELHEAGIVAGFNGRLTGELHAACSAMWEGYRQTAEATWSGTRGEVAAAVMFIPRADLVWEIGEYTLHQAITRKKYLVQKQGLKVHKWSN
uniref:Uncharacterized protein n=1 Tax=Oryza meridionalis TaxID=40149 RepID=A0A0E0D3C9_9ORYZ